jgi:hypothetical protein
LEQSTLATIIASTAVIERGQYLQIEQISTALEISRASPVSQTRYRLRKAAPQPERAAGD